MLDRTSWVVLFLGLPGGRYESDQIRIMKGLFLWSQEGPESSRHLFAFRPYDFGPFDTSIYQDLDSLVATGIVSIEEIAGSSRRLFRLTPSGVRQFDLLKTEALTGEIEQLQDIKLRVTSMGFADLLKHVYAKYPEFAVNSVANV